LVREQIGVESIAHDYEPNDTMDIVRNRLVALGPEFELALSGPVVMACNQTMVRGEHVIAAGDEIAFFPPVTGG
jgi:molybdopterin synthase sulfur carrier subunit